MTQKKTLAAALIAPALALGAIAPSAAMAHGFGFEASVDPSTFAARQSAMFASQAKLLGITVDQMKAYWADGKNVREIADELGISAETLQSRMKEERLARMKEQLSILVAQGVITQAQADHRIEVLSTQTTGGRGGMRGHRGGGHDFGMMGF